MSDFSKRISIYGGRSRTLTWSQSRPSDRWRGPPFRTPPCAGEQVSSLQSANRRMTEPRTERISSPPPCSWKPSKNIETYKLKVFVNVFVLHPLAFEKKGRE